MARSAPSMTWSPLRSAGQATPGGQGPKMAVRMATSTPSTTPLPSKSPGQQHGPGGPYCALACGQSVDTIAIATGIRHVRNQVMINLLFAMWAHCAIGLVWSQTGGAQAMIGACLLEYNWDPATV